MTTTELTYQPPAPPEAPASKQRKTWLVWLIATTGAIVLALIAAGTVVAVAGSGATTAPQARISTTAPTAPAPAVPVPQDAQSIVTADGYPTTQSMMNNIPADVQPYVSDAAVGMSADGATAEAVLILTPAGQSLVPPMMASVVQGSGVTIHTDGRVMRLNGTVDAFSALAGPGTSA